MLVNSDEWSGLEKGGFTVNVYVHIYVRSKKDQCRRYRDGMPKVIEIR